MKTEFIPLPDAASLAFQRLASDPRKRARHAEGVLDVAAIALAACIPIYALGGAPRRLSEDEVWRGSFCRGASRLVFRDEAAPVEGLAVRSDDLEAAIARLGGAGVSFAHATFDPSPRFPRALPA